MASLTVYLAKWSVSQAPGITKADREPNFLFVYAPTSFGWRELLLEGTKVTVPEDARDEKLRPGTYDVVASRSDRLPRAGTTGGVSRWDRINPEARDAYLKSLSWWNKLGAFIVAFWLGLGFLLVLGFGYSFFWTASTIVYLLLRRQVDSAELDEVYLEEDDYEPAFGLTHTTGVSLPPAVSPTPGRSLPVVDAPRPAATAVPAPSAVAVTAPLATSSPVTSAPVVVPPPLPTAAPEVKPHDAVPPQPTPQPEKEEPKPPTS
jgi:hypothetical protein